MNDVPIIQAGVNGTHIGKLDFRVVKEEGGNRISYIGGDTIWTEGPSNAHIDSLVDKVLAVYGLSEKLILAKDALIHDRTINKWEYTPVGAYVTAAYVRSFLENEKVPAELKVLPVIGVNHFGGLRASIPAGEVTRLRAGNVLPFGGNVVAYEFTGERLKQLLDDGKWRIREFNPLKSKKQDKKAADELIRRYYREIYAFTYRQTGERELALDLTQEIFITVLQGIYAFDEKKAGFRTWAYRVAANRITDYYRSKSYKKEKLQQPLQWETEEEKTVRDLAEHMVQKEEIRRIMDIVVSYEREWIRIFQKKCFEEKTFAQIAEEMDLAESTVKTRFYQMLKRIRQEVQR